MLNLSVKKQSKLSVFALKLKVVENERKENHWEKLVWNIIQRIIYKEILQILECLLQSQLSEGNITIVNVGQCVRVLSERAGDGRQILLLHHQRFDWKLVKIIQEQIADFSIFRQINFFLRGLLRLHWQWRGWRNDSMFRAQVTNEMIFPTKFRWAHFAVEARRNSNALVSHVSLQVTSTQVALTTRWTWKAFRLIAAHFRENFRHTS